MWIDSLKIEIISNCCAAVTFSDPLKCVKFVMSLLKLKKIQYFLITCTQEQLKLQ